MKRQKTCEETDRANKQDFISRQHRRTRAHNMAYCSDSAGDWGEAQSVIQCAWLSSVYLPAPIYKQTAKQTGPCVYVCVYVCLCVLGHVQACLDEEQGGIYIRLSHLKMFLHTSFHPLVSRSFCFSTWQRQPRLTSLTCRWQKKKGSWEKFKKPRDVFFFLPSSVPIKRALF